MTARTAILVSLLALPHFVACGDSAARPQPDREAACRFKIDFWGMVETAQGKAERTALTGRHVLRSGAAIGLRLEPSTAKVYVVYQDSAGGLTVLHEPSKGGEKTVDVIEPGTTLDDQSGLERFYVVASRELLPDLSAAIREFREDESKGAEMLLREVMRIRAASEKLDAPAPRPVRIGGQVRGDPTGLEYELRNVFCKTITIDHR